MSLCDYAYITKLQQMTSDIHLVIYLVLCVAEYVKYSL